MYCISGNRSQAPSKDKPLTITQSWKGHREDRDGYGYGDRPGHAKCSCISAGIYILTRKAAEQPEPAEWYIKTQEIWHELWRFQRKDSAKKMPPRQGQPICVCISVPEWAGQGAAVGSLNNGGLNQDRNPSNCKRNSRARTERQMSGGEELWGLRKVASSALRHCGFRYSRGETKMTRLLDLISKIICDKINNWVRLHIMGKHLSPSQNTYVYFKIEGCGECALINS